MPSRAATFADVTAFNARAYAARDYRRAVVGGAVLGLGGVSVVAVMAGTVAVAAAWLVSGSLAGNPEFRARAPSALEGAILPSPPQRLADPADMFGAALATANPAYAPEPMRQAALTPSVAVPAPAPVFVPPLPLPRKVELSQRVPLPLRRPSNLAPIQPERTLARAPIITTPPPATIEAREPVIDVAPARPARESERRHSEPDLAVFVPMVQDTTGSIDGVAPPAAATPAVARPVSPRLAYNNPEMSTPRDSHTAIYDIVAHTVYLPDGERLEAHSGLGRMLDDPHYAEVKGRGPTPPNTYDLTLRRGLFHGVQALRLNPVADSRMYGRDGILAHTYMLGPSGQSFGCVSFKDYTEFLHAFQRGEVDRLVVVPHLPAPPPAARADRARGRQLAFENAH